MPRDLLRIRRLLFFDTDPRGPALSEADAAGIRWATSADIEALVTYGRRRREVEARFVSGARAVVVERDGRLVGDGWFRTDYCEMDDWLRFTGPPDAVWMTGVRVAPEYRGQRLHPRMKMFGAAPYARAGHRHLLTWIEALNRNSQRGSRKTGSRLIGRITIVRFLGFSIIYFNQHLRIGRWHAKRVLELPVDCLLRAAPEGGRAAREGATPERVN